jgi:hypothetical protein
MARTKSDSKSFVEARIDTSYLLFNIARNGGQFLTAQQLGQILMSNESKMLEAGMKAMYAVISDTVDRMAGITPKPLTDGETEVTVNPETGLETKVIRAKK